MEEKKECCCHHKTKERSDKEYKDLINRLSRIEGQVRGIKKMVENDTHMDELMLNGYFYDVNDNYRKIVGRTDNVNTMRNSLYRLANRYTDDDIFTIPVSLNRYVESNNVKSLVKRAARKGAELNDVEKKNLNSFCSFIKKNIDISY